MTPQFPPHWLHPGTVAQARAAQAEMAARIVAHDDLPPRPWRLGAADVSNTRFDPLRRVHAAIVTIDAAGAVVAQADESRVGDFPYVPGYLGFREVPALAAAWARLDPKPDLLLVDGQGLAHPRGLGTACHLGLVLGVPTIGVAKSLLVGTTEPGPAVGDVAPILWKGAHIGTALRTRHGAGPVYVSVGHRVGLDTAVAVVRAACDGRRLPLPIRAAHAAANAVRRAQEAARAT
ncbi:endonuclease V [Roseomonas fluvialis]|uniref:Endonuclease V n=1 Tax=Roseomonas fluvialis TaxID=1750527 RepID=A0ABM7XZZ2_9PROT|nr:endonuclease V [Roseomonas fluvialis]BDG71054.1 endonuclease V [Roseomonas fluvialis]